jgi:hypothetical protein
MHHRTCSTAIESGRQEAKQLRLGPGQIEPREPVRAIKDNHLPVVNWRYIGARLGCWQRWVPSQRPPHRMINNKNDNRADDSDQHAVQVEASHSPCAEKRK